MNWDLAIEKNQAALKRILAMLLAMVQFAGGDGNPDAGRAMTLPRHLHRFVLRLLRPAESATRRLIIVAARGLVVKLPKPRAPNGERPSPRIDPRAMPNSALPLGKHGLPIEHPRGEPISLGAQETASLEEPVHRPRVPFFPMFDPMKRFDRKPVRQRIPEARMPRVTLLNDDGWSVPVYLRRPAPPPPSPTPDDPLDATSIHRRLEMIGRALDDLPRQARRFARWKARRDARLAREREGGEPEKFEVQTTPSPSHPSGSRPLPHFVAERTGANSPALAPVLSTAKWGRGREPEGRDGEGVSWEELGVSEEALALYSRAKLPGRSAQPNIAAQTAKPRRFHRLEPMRPGRPPGWRRKPDHVVHEVLNELHGLAVWARDGP